jgi:hypothetical protein
MRPSDLLGGGLIPQHQLAERELLLAYLIRQRELVCWKLDGLDEEAARSVSTPTGLSPHVIVAHLTGVERGWFREHFAGEPEQRVRDEEFLAKEQSLVQLLAAYRAEVEACDAVIAAHGLDDVSVHRDHSLRWIVLHLIEEISRHLGHLDLLAELADGRLGEEPDGAPLSGRDED